MGMTLWICTLSDRKMSDESDDYTLMYDQTEVLDVMCNKAKKRPLSAFFDTTDLEYNLDESDQDDEPTQDPETGLAYGIDDMEWFDIADGRDTLAFLRAQISSGHSPEISTADRVVLLDEIDGCIARLTKLPEHGKFHLAVIL